MRNRLAALFLVSLAAVLTSCVGSDAEDAKTSTAAADVALEYVNSLRAENDLAHASLEVPSAATLAGVSALVSAHTYAGQHTPAFTVEQLTGLAARSPEWAPGTFSQLCVLADGDPASALSALDPASRTAVQDLTLADALPVRDADAATLLGDVVAALECRDGVPVTLDTRDQSAVRAAVEDLPLPLAVLRQEGVIGSSITPSVAQEQRADLETELTAAGCTDWLQAWAAASLAAGRWSTAVHDCAEAESTVLTDPTVLNYLVAAEVPRETVARLLEHNAEVIDRWLNLEPDFASPGARPAGLGTVGATRDAVTLLRLAGVGELPSWMRTGLQDATSEPERDTLLEADTVSDVLYLCLQLDGACADDVLDRARDAVATQVASLTTAAPDDDERAARAIESAAEAQLDLPECDAQLVARWYESAPLALANLAMWQKACWELIDAPRDVIVADAVKTMESPRYASAAGYVILYVLGTSGEGDSDLQHTVLDAFDTLVERLDESEGVGYYERARPLTMQLLRARLENWTQS